MTRLQGYLLLTSFLLGMSYGKLIAQDDVADLQPGYAYPSFQIWPSVKLSHDFNHGVGASVEYMARLGADMKSFEGHYLSTSLEYKIWKYLRTDFKFRFMTNPLETHYRFEFGLSGRYKIKDATIQARVAYYRDHEYFAARYQRGHFPTNYFRFRLSAKYAFLKNWNLNASIEPYLLFGPSAGIYNGKVRKLVSVVGVDYEFVKSHSLALYYRNQPDFNTKKIDFLHAFGLTYTWDIPDKFKHKKKKGKDKKN